MNYKPVIGLEVHVELKTKSKMFCSCKAEYFGEKPNSNTCPVCLGLPGALPVPNKKAIEWCVIIGLALNCKINLFSKFDRKNYFYPDLPKGYQISQYDEPFAVNGHIVIARSEATKQSQSKEIAARTTFARNDNKVIRIRRVHMEEDTAKLVHEFGNQKSTLPLRSGQELKTQNLDEGYSLIDFNRSGVPLVEIVTDPDFESADEVVQYLKKLRQIVRYLNVSNADMDKGEMRLEPNISLYILRASASESRSKFSTSSNNNNLPNYKVEVKNINSFKFVEKAINYEIERQKRILESSKTPIQETRGWDDEKQITVTQRVKEEAMDYRYFPEADIPPIRWTESQISNIKSQIPELADQKSNRFKKEYDLSTYDSEILVRDKETANYFEEALKVNQELRIMNQESTNSKAVANWMINKKVDTNTILPAQLIKLIINSVQTTVIYSHKLEEIVKVVLQKNPKAVSDYKSGKVQAIGFLIGKVKQHFPRGDTNQIKTALEKYLEN